MEIILNKDGTIEIDLIGFHGKGCSEIAKRMTEAIGKQAKSTKKSEYYKEEHEKQHLHRGM